MPWTDYVYDWQPFLKRGIEAGLFAAGTLSADLAAALLDEGPPTPGAIEDLLIHRAEWLDDATWGTRMATELGLRTVALVSHAGYKNVELVVNVEGIANASRDSRTVVLARRAMNFKRSNHVLIAAGTERILLRFGEYAIARVDGQTRRSVQPIDSERLRAVETQGGSLAELLGLAAQRAPGSPLSSRRPAQPSPARHDTTRHDTTRHDTTRHDTTRHDTTRQ